MSTPTLWLVIAGMTLVTYVPRLSIMALMRRETMPPTITRALRYVPPAALTAIIFPELFMPDGSLALSLVNDRLVAGLVAVVVAWASKNTLLTIAVGMVLLWGLQAV